MPPKEESHLPGAPAYGWALLCVVFALLAGWLSWYVSSATVVPPVDRWATCVLLAVTSLTMGYCAFVAALPQRAAKTFTVGWAYVKSGFLLAGAACLLIMLGARMGDVSPLDIALVLGLSGCGIAKAVRVVSDARNR